jgi:acyl carrier protein
MNATECSGDLMTRLRLCLPPPRREVSDQVPLSQLGLDSLDTVEFLCTVHAEFGIRLREEDIQPEQSLQGLCDVIQKRRNDA